MILLVLAACSAIERSALADVGESVSAALSLRVVSEEKLDAREPSGVTVLPDGRILVVDDERGLYDATNGERVRPPHANRIDGAEGVAVSADGKTLYVVAEDDHTLHSLKIRADGSFGEPHVVGKLPKSEHSNDGWEGAAWRNGKLVLVHEGHPRRVGFFDPENMDDEPLLFALPDDLKDELADLSDVAVDPKTGNLLLLSDASSAIAEVAVGRGGLRTVALRKLPFAEGLHPEGIAVAPDGRLLVVTEKDHTLRVLAR